MFQSHQDQTIYKKLCWSACCSINVYFFRTFQDSSLPDIWKSATVIPLFKKGSKLDPGNYRPVSLTYISCKIMESIIRDHIAGQLNNSAGLSASQHGFTKGRPCVTNLLTAFELWTKWIDEGFGVDIVYWTTVKRLTRMIMSNWLRSCLI